MQQLYILSKWKSLIALALKKILGYSLNGPALQGFLLALAKFLASLGMLYTSSLCHVGHVASE